MAWKVTKGNYILNVQLDEQNVKSFYAGDILPEGYEPHKSYVANRIVELAGNNTLRARKAKGE